MSCLYFDGNCVFARAWYAALAAGNKDGLPIDYKSGVPDIGTALTLSVRTVFRLINPGKSPIEGVTHTFFAWDAERNPEKVDRSPKPVEYDEYRQILKDILTLTINARHCEMPGYEADDIIATATVTKESTDTDHIVSSDKDLMQLVRPGLQFYCLNNKAVLTTSFICNKFYVKAPHHIAIALAITGDKVDSIKGIKGWGPKKVKKLFNALNESTTLEEALSYVENNIPQDFYEDFYNSLARTIPNAKVPDVPNSSKIEYCDLADVKGIGIPDIEDAFLDTKQSWQAFRD